MRQPLAQPITLDFDQVWLIKTPRGRALLDVLSSGEVAAALAQKADRSDPRLSDARLPLRHGSGLHDDSVEATANKGAAGGYCPLDSSSLVPLANLPAVAPSSLPAGFEGGWFGPIATIPSGWLFCDGSEVSRSTFAALFAAIGTIYGIGDGATTFNLPLAKDKFPAGANCDLGGVPVSFCDLQYGGSNTHTHSFTTSGHAHSFNGSVDATGSCADNVPGCPPFDLNTGSADNGHTHQFSGTTDGANDTGTTDSSDTIPPFYTRVVMIKS